MISLLAGIFVLLGGGMRLMMSALIGSYGYGGYGGMMGGYGWFGSMMNGYNGYGFGMMRGLGSGFGLIGVLGLVFGIIVIISALMLNSRPREHTTWGILIVVFSVLSVMGGFGIGVLLGIVGGILAITWKP